MTEYTRQLIYGLKPIKRENPKPGESEWYYVDPRGAESATDMKTIDVPNEFSPNPYADEIQDYIYEHDKYNYEQLYGDTPPPMSQSVIDDVEHENNNVLSNNGFDTGSSFDENSFDNINNSIMGKGMSDYINNEQSEIKPNYITPNPQKFSYGEIILDGLKGFGEGIESGVLRGLNAATLGGYDVVNHWLLDNQYEKNQDYMQQLAEDNGLGGYNKFANYIIEAGTGGKVANKLLKVGGRNVKKILKKLY